MISVEDIVSSLLRDAKINDYAGKDPFDGLNSKFFYFFPRAKTGLLGLFWTQLHKRSAINFRTVFFVPDKRNPKGIGLFILGLLENYQSTNEQSYLDEAVELANWLLTQQSDRTLWGHSCWGYHFDWNARAFFVPKGKPNVITTVYVAQALWALGEIINSDKYREPAIDSANFIVKHLYTELDGECFFSYIPGETALVYNASLWGAAWVAKIASITGNSQYKKLSLAVARQSVLAQSYDGSWVYGTRHHHQFIDSFHTGYNLEALTLLADSLSTDEFKSSIELGFKFYKTQFFEADGTAKYYHNNRYPLDMHSVSQAVLTLLKVGGTPDDLIMADRIISNAIEILYLKNKRRFVYQKNQYYTNKIDYIRWTKAWVYYSFSYYQRYIFLNKN